MVPEDIRLQRLYRQQLLQPQFTDVQEVVTHMAAMQAQEYAMVQWAVALRMASAVTDAQIDTAFNDGRILRTHIMRPTWHFVAPQDIRMMLQLTAPRVNQANAFMYRKYGVEIADFNRFNTIIEKLLRDSNYLSRDQIREQLAIEGDGTYMSILMMRAELDGIICSGPRKGNQFTYALLEERVPKARAVTKDETLLDVCRRYYTSRGPATVKDFTTWSGLTMAEAKKGLLLLNKEVETITIGNTAYYYIGDTPKILKGRTDFLMPDYDEYGMGYKDRSVLANPDYAGQPSKYSRAIIVNGMMAGSWKRTLQKDTVQLELQLFDGFKNDAAIEKMVNEYGAFLEKKVEMV
jgi:hypothetical protein